MSVPVTVPNRGRAMLMQGEPIRLLDVDPDRGAALAPKRSAPAERALVVSTCCLQVRAGEAPRTAGLAARRSSSRGLLLRELIVADHLAAPSCWARAT